MFEAADLFASSATGAAAGRAARGEDDVRGRGSRPQSPSPSLLPWLRQRNPIRTIPASRPPPVDPVVQAYVSAIARGDRAALLAVYPAAPAELLATLGKRPAGSTLRLITSVS